MHITVEMPPYECSKCGSRNIENHREWIAYDLRDWQECKDCGHNNKPKPARKPEVYTVSRPKVIKF